MSEELLPLPEPDGYAGLDFYERPATSVLTEFPSGNARFTADQMHAYARAHLAAQQAEPVAVFDEFKGRPVLLSSATLLAHGDKLYATPPKAVALECAEIADSTIENGGDPAWATANNIRARFGIEGE